MMYIEDKSEEVGNNGNEKFNGEENTPIPGVYPLGIGP